VAHVARYKARDLVTTQFLESKVMILK
jgi:hypothetical protein